jgi:hypothetical protein
MKSKLFILIFALTAATSVSAEHISSEQALARFKSSRKATAAVKAVSSANLVENQTIFAADNTAALYLYSTGKTTVVLPADDRAKPLLGYFDAPTDNVMPEQLQWWLNEYARQIAYVQSNNIPVALADDNNDDDDYAPISPMTTTLWNQSTPYNILCPTIDGTPTMTGCVATAAAQVMKYHNYPLHGIGSTSYTDIYDNVRSMNFDETTFDWDNMIADYTANYTDEQALAVAQLMKACGYAAGMNYGTIESSADGAAMANAFVQHFGYDEAAAFLNRDFYDFSTWQELIYNNLKTVGPLFYGGTNINSGHAFVCDGYDKDGFFHFNWGWSGLSDGYFQLSALTPTGQGIGSNVGGYTFNQCALFNITTPGSETIEVPEQAPITLLGNLVGSLAGDNTISFTSDAANYQGAVLQCTSYSTEGIYLSFRAENTETDEVTVLDNNICEYLDIAYNQTIQNFTLYFGNKLNLKSGTYKLYIVVSDVDDDDDEWMDINHSFYNADFCYITVDDNGKITQVGAVDGLKPTVSNLKLESNLFLGENFKFSFDIANFNDDDLFAGLVPVMFVLDDNGALGLIAQGTGISFDMAAGESLHQTCVSEMTVANEYYGDAYFGIMSSVTGNIYAYIPTTVYEISDAPEIVSTKFTFDGDANNADATNLKFNCAITCNSGHYYNPISVYICDATGNVITTLKSAETYFLNAGDSATTTVSGSADNLTPGATYRAVLGYVFNGSAVMLNSLSLTFGETSGITDASTDADIATGTDIATEYYNLQGIRITTPTGIHIVKRGNTATLRRQP